MMAPNTSPGASMRNVERIFEDAQLKGVLLLNSRKLKEFPKIACKYDMYEVLRADVSGNRLSELPHELCSCPLLEDLDAHNNLIRSVPDALFNLHALTCIDLSRNQLSVFPASVCLLSSLQVCILRNNRLISIPEEIANMSCLRDLDVSCNEITIVPPQLGSVSSLQRLNLKRNLLLEIPIELCELRLVSLDVSCNRLSALPLRLRHMTSLQHLHLEQNPITFPPATLCSRGRVHVFKFLELQAIKEDKRGMVLETECHKYRSPSLCEARNGLGCRKSYTFDSGYSTSDQESQDLNFKKYSAESPRWESTLSIRNQNTNTLFNYIPSGGGGEDEDSVQTFKEYKEALKRRREAEYKKDGHEQVSSKQTHQSSGEDRSVISPRHAPEQTNDKKVEDRSVVSPRHQPEQTNDRKICFAEKKTLSTEEASSPLNSSFSWPKNSPVKASKSSFTMKREFDKAREEQELISQLREVLESRLKLRLPQEMENALSDGVFLCHLANHIRPNAVTCIHVPSPAVPKLTVAKCRRNADNFLEACRRLGVPNDLLCSPQDILGEQGGLVRIAITVQELTQSSAPKQDK